MAFFVLLFNSQSNVLFAQAKKDKTEKVKKNKKEPGPPPWAPAHGYRAKTRYVYFKDHDVYYDNDKGVYISMSGKNWKVEAKLPDVLKNVDLKLATKIDLEFDGDKPQSEHKKHLELYPKDKS